MKKNLLLLLLLVLGPFSFGQNWSLKTDFGQLLTRRYNLQLEKRLSSKSSILIEGEIWRVKKHAYDKEKNAFAWAFWAVSSDFYRNDGWRAGISFRQYLKETDNASNFYIEPAFFAGGHVVSFGSSLQFLLSPDSETIESSMKIRSLGGRITGGFQKIWRKMIFDLGLGFSAQNNQRVGKTGFELNEFSGTQTPFSKSSELEFLQKLHRQMRVTPTIRLGIGVAF